MFSAERLFLVGGKIPSVCNVSTRQHHDVGRNLSPKCDTHLKAAVSRFCWNALCCIVEFFLSKLLKIQLVTCFNQVELKTDSFWLYGVLTSASSSFTFLTRLRRVFFFNFIFNVCDGLLLVTSPADRPLASNPLAFFFFRCVRKKTPEASPKRRPQWCGGSFRTTQRW